MVSGDNKASKASSSRGGGIRTLSDLNRRSAESESNSDGPKGGEKSEMLVQDPSKSNIVEAIFNQARQRGAIERPFDQFKWHPCSASVQSAPQQPPEAVVAYIDFWSNGFTVNNGPLRSLDDPENATFLESIKKSQCPKELEPADRRSSVKVNLIRRSEKYPEPEKRHVAFQGVGRTLGSSSSSAAPEPTSTLTPPSSGPTPSAGVFVDQLLPSTSIQLRLADGTRLVSQFNNNHTIRDIRAFIDASVPGSPRNYQLQMGFPPKLLTDETQTIEQAGLGNSVVIQKF